MSRPGRGNAQVTPCGSFAESPRCPANEIRVLICRHSEIYKNSGLTFAGSHVAKNSMKNFQGYIRESVTTQISELLNAEHHATRMHSWKPGNIDNAYTRPDSLSSLSLNILLPVSMINTIKLLE